MAHIEVIDEADATGELAALYRRFGNPDGTVDNVLKAHSLNPESLAAHCALYVQSMHRPSPVSRVEREMIGVTVSRLNGCAYCLRHHGAGLRRLLPEARERVASDVATGRYERLTARERAMCLHAEAITTRPGAITAESLAPLREQGVTDREILDVTQVAAYFAYANRVVLALGAALESEDALGQWPAQ